MLLCCTPRKDFAWRAAKLPALLLAEHHNDFASRPWAAPTSFESRSGVEETEAPGKNFFNLRG